MNNQEDHVQEGTYNERLFQKYVLWKSMPTFILRPPADKSGVRMASSQFCDTMGIDDDEILELAEVKSQREFSEKYGVHINTTTQWNKMILKRDALADMRGFFFRLGKNVAMAMYNNALSSKNLNADRDRLNFMKIVMGFNEKTIHEHQAGETFFDLLKKSLDKNGNRTNDTITAPVPAAAVSQPGGAGSDGGQTGGGSDGPDKA